MDLVDLAAADGALRAAYAPALGAAIEQGNHLIIWVNRMRYMAEIERLGPVLAGWL